MNSIVRFVLENPNSTQCTLFALVVVTLWLTEQAVSGRPAREKLRHTSLNVLYMCALLPIQLILIMACVGVANWTQQVHWGLVYLLPNAESWPIKLVVMFFVLDFLDYVYHVIAHRFRPLWTLHSLHHSDRAVDVSTTFREHPGETLVRVCFLITWVFLCGASVEVLVLRQTIETFSNVSQHTVFRLPRLPARILGWFFITSNLHHTHHHWQRPGTNCNYGDVFSIWDRLFGTYVDLPAEELVFGLDSLADRDPDETLLKILSRISHSRWWPARGPRLRLEGSEADAQSSAEGVHSIAA
jgi:sterol desaturase/sphingolipid hydroxylase (fatty acid hydroxylase superfamily)